MKKMMAVLLVLAMVFCMAACGGGGESEPVEGGQEFVLTISDVQVNTPYEQGLLMMADLVSERTEGKVQIQTYAGTLGGEKQIVEAVRMGTLDMAQVGTTTYELFDNMPLPFLFKDSDHALAVAESEIGQVWKDKCLEDWGLYTIGNAYFAERILTTSKEINSIDNLKGLKIRVPETEVYIKTWETLGAAPTPLAWTEVYSALQQNTVDAQENPVQLVCNAKLYEVQDYLYVTNHATQVRWLLINKDIWAALGAEYQQIIDEAYDEAAAWMREEIMSATEGYFAECEANGMQIIDVDTTEWKNRTADLTKEYCDRIWGEGVYDQIMNFDY